MKPTFAISILGNVQSACTEAEISSPDKSGIDSVWAVVSDTKSGWHVTFIEAGFSLSLETVVSALKAAQEALKHYVNRRGENPPEGLTVADFSMWLMEKDEGTAMGRRVR